MILVVQTSLATLASLPVTPPGRCGIHAPWMHPIRTTWLDSEPAFAANQAASQARTLAARTLLPKAADLLREGFGATRVGAFGCS